ncbi:MAG: hypothetical protein ABSG46_04650, partial [Candidatus Binataceae bacterium]
MKKTSKRERYMRIAFIMMTALAVLAFFACSASNPSAGSTANQTTLATEAPTDAGEFEPYNAELHAICDEYVQMALDGQKSNTDPAMQAYIKYMSSLWSDWQDFPDRWKFCREGQEKQCQDFNDLKSFITANPDSPLAKAESGSCDKVGQLDNLMQRFEAAMQAARQEDNQLFQQLEEQQTTPTHTDCRPNSLGGGFS